MRGDGVEGGEVEGRECQAEKAGGGDDERDKCAQGATREQVG